MSIKKITIKDLKKHIVSSKKVEGGKIHTVQTPNAGLIQIAEGNRHSKGGVNYIKTSDGVTHEIEKDEVVLDTDKGPYVVSDYMNIDGTKNYNKDKTSYADLVKYLAMAGATKQDLERIAMETEIANGNNPNNPSSLITDENSGAVAKTYQQTNDRQSKSGKDNFWGNLFGPKRTEVQIGGDDIRLEKKGNKINNQILEYNIENGDTTSVNQILYTTNLNKKNTGEKINYNIGTGKSILTGNDGKVVPTPTQINNANTPSIFNTGFNNNQVRTNNTTTTFAPPWTYGNVQVSHTQNMQGNNTFKLGGKDSSEAESVNTFRKWMNETHPTWKYKNESLDKTGPMNKYVTEALNQYGVDFVNASNSQNTSSTKTTTEDVSLEKINELLLKKYKYQQPNVTLSLGGEANHECGPGVKKCGDKESPLTLQRYTGFNYNLGNKNVGMDLDLGTQVSFGRGDTRFGAPVLQTGLSGNANADTGLFKNPDLENAFTLGLDGYARLGYKKKGQEGRHDWSPDRTGFEVGAQAQYDLRNKHINNVGVYGNYGAFTGNAGYNPQTKTPTFGVGIKLKEGGYINKSKGNLKRLYQEPIPSEFGGGTYEPQVIPSHSTTPQGESTIPEGYLYQYDSNLTPVTDTSYTYTPVKFNAPHTDSTGVKHQNTQPTQAEFNAAGFKDVVEWREWVNKQEGFEEYDWGKLDYWGTKHQNAWKGMQPLVQEKKIEEGSNGEGGSSTVTDTDGENFDVTSNTGGDDGDGGGSGFNWKKWGAIGLGGLAAYGAYAGIKSMMGATDDMINAAKGEKPNMIGKHQLGKVDLQRISHRTEMVDALMRNQSMDNQVQNMNIPEGAKYLLKERNTIATQGELNKIKAAENNINVQIGAQEGGLNAQLAMKQAEINQKSDMANQLESRDIRDLKYAAWDRQVAGRQQLISDLISLGGQGIEAVAMYKSKNAPLTTGNNTGNPK